MPTIIQTVAGAAQFTGATTATGRVNFPAHPDLEKWRPVLLSVSFYSTAVVASMNLLLVEGVTATAISVLARDTTGTRDSMDYPCNRKVQITAARTGYWRLEFITTGKTATGTLQVDYIIMPAGMIP